MPRKSKSSKPTSKATESYKHPESESLMRPEVGTQAQFKKKLPPQKYRYDDSLAPVLEWDSQNPARERGETHLAAAESELAAAAQKGLVLEGMLKATQLSTSMIAEEAKSVRQHLVSAQSAVSQLKAMSKPFLNWSGKAERISFDVPTLPLFIHERLSTQAILETLKGHKRDKQMDMAEMFGDPRHSVVDQTTRAYEFQDPWVNRMVLGDSLVVMNSLLRYEKLGGQVQMIYIDPPYGVKFGSNFQPFVRKRDVSHNDDEDMTREPEMVQAYRDTWELGLHSYLTYLRDRLVMARELLSPSGSLFVQISDENVHRIRDVLDEVFGTTNFIAIVTFRKRTSATADYLGEVNDYLLWYAKDYSQLKYRQLFQQKLAGSEAAEHYSWVENPETGELSKLDGDADNLESLLTDGHRLVASDSLMTAERSGNRLPFEFGGKDWDPGEKNNWKTSHEGLARLVAANRVIVSGNTLRYKRYLSDFPAYPLTTSWDDTTTFTQRFYVVQTIPKVIQRCLLMTTDPGDLVLDPTCGSGTTAYVAEQWGRRWITIDTSRVPLALARQRLLTATFPWYELKDEARGPVGGFTYVRKQNNKGEEVGGIVPHVTLKSIANNEPPAEEVLVDRPEIDNKVTRITGRFCFEATIPTPMDLEPSALSSQPSAKDADLNFVDRMIEVLRKSPVLRLEGNRTVTLKNVRPPAKTLSLSAEALVDATAPGQKPSLADAVQEAREKNGLALPLSAQPVAFVFGPENGAVNEGLVYNAAKEAFAKSYTHLYITGFAIQPNARELIEKCDQVVGIPATYVQATPDLMMGDLLKNMRSSQVFSVCGMPEAAVRKLKDGKYEVELLGLDVFDPTTMEVLHRRGDEVPAWLLDTDYNELCFHVSQAFFPKTGAWENLKKALRGDYEETVWDHLSGTVSAPFEAGDLKKIAVKVIDERGNELLIVKNLGN